MKTFLGAIIVCLFLLYQEAIASANQADGGQAAGGFAGNPEGAFEYIQTNSKFNSTRSSTETTATTVSGSSTETTATTVSGSSTETTATTVSGSTSAPKLIEVTVRGLVYDDGEPEEWDDELKERNSEEWKDLNDELCETITDAFKSQADLNKALKSCNLTEVNKVRVQNFHDGEDEDDDDEDDTDDDKDDDNDGNDSSDDNNDDETDDSDSSNDKNKLRKSTGHNKKVRPNRGQWMDGVEATVNLIFDQNLAPSLNYSQQHIEKLIATQGAKNGTSSFGRNVGKDYPNGATRHGYFSWIVGLLTLVSLTY